MELPVFLVVRVVTSRAESAVSHSLQDWQVVLRKELPGTKTSIHKLQIICRLADQFSLKNLPFSLPCEPQDTCRRGRSMSNKANCLE